MLCSYTECNNDEFKHEFGDVIKQSKLNDPVYLGKYNFNKRRLLDIIYEVENYPRT